MNVSTSIATIQPEPEILEAHKRIRHVDDTISDEKHEDTTGPQDAASHKSDDNCSGRGTIASTLIDEEWYPEGGLRAWLVVFGSFISMVAAFGILNSFGTFQSYLSEHQLRGYDQSTIGWIFSLYVFFTFFCGVQIGPIFDAKGPRVLILIGSVLLTASMMLLGLCTGRPHMFYLFFEREC